MTLQEFIDENKAELNQIILKAVPTADIDDEEREMWINNDEGLYNWAKESGVDFDEE